MQLRSDVLIAAPFTPFRPDGQVDLKTISQQARLLVTNGVGGGFVCGTTGEGLSLTVEERMQVAEAWREAVDEDFALIVHVGHTSLADSRRLAEHAQAIGADAIGAMAPCFYRPANVEDLVRYCVQLAEAAPDLPFFYYHIPSMTGVDLPMWRFLEIASERMPTLAGIKFSDSDLMDLSRCVQFEEGRYTILFGKDEILMAGLCLGASGAVGSTYNYAAPLYHRLIEAFRRGDLEQAQQEQHRSQQMIAFLYQFGGLATGKAIMRLVGIDCGGVRPPLRDLSPAQVEALEVGLRRIGFFEFCSRLA